MNEKQVNNLYLQTLLQNKTDIEPEQLANLWSIASQCPDDGGEAVYRARALYAFYQPDATFDDAITCDQSSIQDRNSKTINVSGSLAIFPNPASDKWIVKSPIDLSNPNITIVDIAGKIVLSLDCLDNENQFVINTSELKSGLYFINLQESGKTIFTDKISIFK